MKKVLSIVLAVMMLVSLFAVSASASVATYEGYEAVTIMPLSENVKSALPYIRLNGGVSEGVLSGFTTVDDNEVAILKSNPAASEWLFGGEKSKMALYDKFVLTFDLKAVDCSRAFQIGMKTGVADIAASIMPATFVGKELTQGSNGNAIVENADVTKINQWFNFRVTIDPTAYAAAIAAGKDGQSARIAAMKIEMKKAEEEKYTVLSYMTAGYYGNKVGARADSVVPTWTNTGVAFSANCNGYAICLDAEGNNLAHNAEYHLDNVCLVGRTNKITYPAKGVMVAENFEGTSPVFAGATATVKGDDANKYLEFYRSDSVNSYGYGTSAEFRPESLPQEFVVTLDVCKEADNTQDFYIEYFTDTLGVTDAKGNLIAGAASNIWIDANKFEVGKWYTIKVARKNIVYPVVTMIDKTTGETETFSALSRSNVSGSSSYNRLFFRALNTAESVSHWKIDNVMVAEAGAASIISKTVDEETGAKTVKLNVDSKDTSATPVLATFKGDRLVAADFVDTVDVALSADGAVVDLVAGGEYDEAVLYLWKGIGGAPLMEAWDITANLAD